MNYEIKLRPAARRDLIRLAQFVADLDERAGAKREDALDAALQRLSKRPLIGRPGAKPNTHEHTIKFGRSSYLVRYLVRDNTVTILRIWHGKENQPR